jgi:hypothetical protein
MAHASASTQAEGGAFALVPVHETGVCSSVIVVSSMLTSSIECDIGIHLSGTCFDCSPGSEIHPCVYHVHDSCRSPAFSNTSHRGAQRD